MSRSWVTRESQIPRMQAHGPRRLREGIRNLPKSIAGGAWFGGPYFTSSGFQVKTQSRLVYVT